MLASSRATYGKFSGKKQPKRASSRATCGKVSGTLLGNELMIGQQRSYNDII